MEILNSCLDCDEIQFKEDGSWAPMRSKKEVQEVSASYNGIDGQSQLLLIISSYCWGTAAGWGLGAFLKIDNWSKASWKP